LAKALTPVVRTTLSEATLDQLMSSVMNGYWKVGDRIPPERELCARLGIARTSLREALKAMELIGMLESRVGEGTFVCPRSEFLARPLLWAFTSGGGTDHTELKEIREARALLEQDLAGLAAIRASDDEIKQIADTVELMREQASEGQSILEQDLAFHLAISSSAHNDVLNSAVQLLRNLQRQWIHLMLLLPHVPDQVLNEHRAIYEAIRSRDVAGARQAMQVHLEHSGKLVEQLSKIVADRTDRQPSSGGIKPHS
jgi:GntR family transcriptional regulator, transcriptional repressor for pyruvate dehydrogenase complex